MANMEIGSSSADSELVSFLRNTFQNIFSNSLNINDETLNKIFRNLGELAHYISDLFTAFKTIGWSESTTLAFIVNYLVRGEGALCEDYKAKLNFTDSELTVVLSYISKCKTNLEYLTSVWLSVSECFYVNLYNSFGSIMSILPKIASLIVQPQQQQTTQDPGNL